MNFCLVFFVLILLQLSPGSTEKKDTKKKSEVIVNPDSKNVANHTAVVELKIFNTTKDDVKSIREAISAAVVNGSYAKGTPVPEDINVRLNAKGDSILSVENSGDKPKEKDDVGKSEPDNIDVQKDIPDEDAESEIDESLLDVLKVGNVEQVNAGESKTGNIAVTSTKKDLSNPNEGKEFVFDTWVKRRLESKGKRQKPLVLKKPSLEVFINNPVWFRGLLRNLFKRKKHF